MNIIPGYYWVYRRYQRSTKDVWLVRKFIMLKAVLICIYVRSGAQELTLCQTEGTEAKRQ